MGKQALWSSCGGQMGRADHTYVDADVSADDDADFDADFDADQTIDKGESGEREGVFDHRPGSQVSSPTQGGQLGIRRCQDTDTYIYTNTKYNNPKMINNQQAQTQLRELDVHNCPALTAASLQAINR